VELVEIGQRKPLRARIVQAGGDRVVRDVVEDRAVRAEVADAAL